jgi:hypothetical protein
MSWWNSNKFYSSGDTPKYKVGDILWLHEPWQFDGLACRRESKQCEVTDVSTSKSGLFFKEFTYKVRFLETGRKYKAIYESQLAREKQRGQYSDPDIGDPFPSNDEEDK